MTASIRSLLLVAAFAVATLVAIDVAIQRFVPLQHMREVADGMAQLESSDPEILVVGSSHARTFHVLGEQLARATGRDTPLVAIPLENGKLVPYDWLLKNRVAPLLDEKRADGSPRYSKLRRFILLTEWWDSCAYPDGVHWNLPSRAWGLENYVADVLAQGMTPYNRNFSQYQFRQMFRSSTLVRDRTEPRIREGAARLATGRPIARTQSEFDGQIGNWRTMIERGTECIGSSPHMAALDSILGFSAQRGLETTVVLFPRMPGTLTDRAKATTLARFAELVEGRALPVGARVIDLTWRTPLRDGDFMADFDHVNAAGNLKFARWALENDLSFLLTPSPPREKNAAPTSNVTP